MLICSPPLAARTASALGLNLNLLAPPAGRASKRAGGRPTERLPLAASDGRAAQPARQALAPPLEPSSLAAPRNELPHFPPLLRGNTTSPPSPNPPQGQPLNSCPALAAPPRTLHCGRQRGSDHFVASRPASRPANRPARLWLLCTLVALIKSRPEQGRPTRPLARQQWPPRRRPPQRRRWEPRQTQRTLAGHL